MKKTVLISFTAAALMITSAALTKAITPTVKLADHQAPFKLETAIPKHFGHWRVDEESGANVMPTPDVQANLDKIYDQILSRTYVNEKGERIMLTITYGSSQTQDLRAHRQEVCYSAQGFEINSLAHEELSIFGHPVSATRMFAEKGQRKEPVTYWFTMGDQVVLSRTERFLVQLKYSFSGLIPDGVLVRVSSINQDKSAAYDLQMAFLNEMMPVLEAPVISKLLGASAQ